MFHYHSSKITKHKIYMILHAILEISNRSWCNARQTAPLCHIYLSSIACMGKVLSFKSKGSCVSSYSYSLSGSWFIIISSFKYDRCLLLSALFSISKNTSWLSIFSSRPANWQFWPYFLDQSSPVPWRQPSCNHPAENSQYHIHVNFKNRAVQNILNATLPIHE